VTRHAYEAIVTEMLERLACAGPVQGVILELHGAMVSEHLEDAEGDLLARVREVVGPSVPLVATLDLHANVSDAMLASADALEAFRTYPHMDMAETGGRAARILLELLDRPQPWFKANRRLPYLIPTPWQCTEIEPVHSIYARLVDSVNREVPSLSFTPAFNAADVPCCGPVVFGYGRTQTAVDRIVGALYRDLVEAESHFGEAVYDAVGAVDVALAPVIGASGPVVIADAEDNPGGGGAGDTTSLLHELVRRKARNAVVATIFDARAADKACEAGVGALIDLDLGGAADGKSFHARFEVERLGSGDFEATGPMLRGVQASVGPMAVLCTDEVRVIVASQRFQVDDQAILRHVGIEPREQGILVLKSAVHFRNDFQEIASSIIVAAAGGLSPIDPRKLPFRRLDPTLRLFPRATVGA
jgi:microcystin degradation protein MlrC